MIPTSKDLRATVERTLSQRVYDQGRTNACGGYAVKTALECLRELAGLPYRPISAQWGYARAQEFGGYLGQDVGSGQENLSKALSIGWLFEDQYTPEVRPSEQDELARLNGPVRCTPGFPPGTDALHALRRSLAMGLPVIIQIGVGESLWAGINGDDWRLHNPTAGEERNTHWCVAVGYDDNVERVLVEDSSGPAVWDGGFFGLPYNLIKAGGYIKSAWRIEHAPTVPFPVLDIGEQAALTAPDVGRWFDASRASLPADVVAAYLNGAPIAFWSTALQAFERVRPMLLSAGVIALQDDGVTGLLAWCKAHGISDLMLEVLAGWPRGTVRRYFDANSTDVRLLDWVAQ